MHVSTICFLAIMLWIKSNRELRQKHLVSLMSAVRLSLLPVGFLMETVVNDPLLHDSIQCRDLLDEAKYFQMSQFSLVPTRSSRRTRPRMSYAGDVIFIGCSGDGKMIFVCCFAFLCLRSAFVMSCSDAWNCNLSQLLLLLLLLSYNRRPRMTLRSDRAACVRRTG